MNEQIRVLRIFLTGYSFKGFIVASFCLISTNKFVQILFLSSENKLVFEDIQILKQILRVM